MSSSCSVQSYTVCTVNSIILLNTKCPPTKESKGDNSKEPKLLWPDKQTCDLVPGWITSQIVDWCHSEHSSIFICLKIGIINSTLITTRKVSWTANQHIKMVSLRSCDLKLLNQLQANTISMQFFTILSFGINW